jgi:hypothetical protein
MKDIIDLGNRVFDRLIEAHGELPESRTIFLYGITTGSTWFILGTEKTVTIEDGGLTKNFEDIVLDALDSEWKQLKFNKELAAAQQIKRMISPENQANSPKDGDTFNWWNNEGEFREIKM